MTKTVIVGGVEYVEARPSGNRAVIEEVTMDATEARGLVQRALELADELDSHDEHGPNAEDVAKFLRQLAEALEEKQ